jgi:hypothetical protein
MQKKFTFGLIALLGVSLFFLGCDDSSDDGGGDDSTTPFVETEFPPGATGGQLVKNGGEYYLFSNGENYGPLTGDVKTIVTKLDAGKLSYFDINVTCDDGNLTLAETEGVVLVSSRIENGVTVTIPAFEGFSDDTGLQNVTPVYIEDYSTTKYEGDFETAKGKGSTIEVQSGAFVFIPYRDNAESAGDYGKQNYGGIIRVKAGGALLDQGAAGFSIGPAGYWFEYGSIALIQAYKDFCEEDQGNINYDDPTKFDDYDPLKIYIPKNEAGKKANNGLWIAPSTFTVGNMPNEDGAYTTWEDGETDNGANGSGSFAWVAGSAFGVNGNLTINRPFALSQELNILPGSTVTVKYLLLLGTDGDKTINVFTPDDDEMTNLGLTLDTTIQPQVVLGAPTSVIAGTGYILPNDQYDTNKIVVSNGPGATDPVTYVPCDDPDFSDSDAAAGYETNFPWKEAE